MQNERVVYVTAYERADPAAGANGTDADHLARCVLIMVLFEHMAAVLIQRITVGVEQLSQAAAQRIDVLVAANVVDLHELGWLGLEPESIAVEIGELVGCLLGVLRTRLGYGAVQRFRRLRFHRLLQMGEAVFYIEMGVPSVEEAHLREFP